MVQQLVRVVTSWCDDGVLVEACTCMANLSFRRVPLLLFTLETCVVFVIYQPLRLNAAVRDFDCFAVSTSATL